MFGIGANGMDVAVDESFFRYLLLELTDHEIDRHQVFTQPDWDLELAEDHMNLLDGPITEHASWRSSAALLRDTVVRYFRPSQSENFRMF